MSVRALAPRLPNTTKWCFAASYTVDRHALAFGSAPGHLLSRRQPGQPAFPALDEFDIIAQSWDASFKAVAGSDFCARQTWGVRGAERWLFRDGYVLEKMDYPRFKRACCSGTSPEHMQRQLGVGATGEVVFTETSAEAYRYRDAVRFNNGREVLLQSLDLGFRESVFGGSRTIQRKTLYRDGQMTDGGSILRRTGMAGSRTFRFTNLRPASRSLPPTCRYK